jgi:hypothetical protein
LYQSGRSRGVSPAGENRQAPRHYLSADACPPGPFVHFPERSCGHAGGHSPTRFAADGQWAAAWQIDDGQEVDLRYGVQLLEEFKPFVTISSTSLCQSVNIDCKHVQEDIAQQQFDATRLLFQAFASSLTTCGS